MATFERSVGPLRDAFTLTLRSLEADLQLPPIIAVPRSLTSPTELVAAIDRDDGAPETVIGAAELPSYTNTDAVGAPHDAPYLLTGVELGDDNRNIAPQDAVAAITSRGRSPLTIDEGLAIFGSFPDSIAPNWGFSLAGSSRGDRRVPALWISKGRPKLGWCYSGAPHTWLGTASCAERISI